MYLKIVVYKKIPVILFLLKFVWNNFIITLFINGRQVGIESHGPSSISATSLKLFSHDESIAEVEDVYSILEESR